jgi:hypothetical protein
MSAQRVETRLAVARFTTALPPGAARYKHSLQLLNLEDAEYPHDELRELEKARRKALGALASLHPGNPEAFDHLAILDHLDNLQQNSGAYPHERLDLNVAFDSVLAERHWRRSQPVVGACELLVGYSRPLTG